MIEYEVKVTSVTTVYVEAVSEDEAIERAGTIFLEHDADEINCEIVGRSGVEEDEESAAEGKNEVPLLMVLCAVERALGQYDSDNVDVVVNEETGKFDVIYHSDNNSFAIEDGVVDAKYVCLSHLAKCLDKLDVGHCW